MLPFIIIGIVSGSVYGLAGVGLVLTYKTSGIFNFAQGALATVAAYAFYYLNVDAGLAWPVAALISVFALGAVLGLGFEFMARRVARGPLAWRIVATIGIVLVVEAVFTIVHGSSTLTTPHFLSQSTVQIFGAFVTYEQIIVTVISLGAAIALYVFFRTARLGKAMRAVVDDPDLLGLAGTSPERVRRWAWVIGCTFAAMSGVLLAPSVPLDPNVLTLLIVQAFGAAAIGGFTSLPLTLAGGLLIGIISSILTEYINSTSLLAGLPPSLPFIVLFLVILFSPRGRLAVRQLGLRRAQIAWQAPGRVQLAGLAAVAVFLVLVPSWVGYQITGWTLALTYVILLLSLGLLAKTSGQVSLCHITFAAIGAVAFSKLSSGGVPWIPALLICGLIVVPIGAVLAIPAIRLSGLYLALATFGFGLLVQDMFYNSSVMFGVTNIGISMPMPHLSWLTVDSNTGFYYVVLLITALAAVAVVVLTRSRLGRLLRSMSDSPLALTTSGTSVRVTMVIVFCISAYLAGIAGALSGMVISTASGANFPPLESLSLIALIMITVGGAPWYALIGAAGLGLVPVYLNSANTTNWLEIIFGIAAITGAMGLQPQMPPALVALLDRLGGRGKRKVQERKDTRSVVRTVPADSSGAHDPGSRWADGRVRRSHRGGRPVPHRGAGQDHRAHRPQRRGQDHRLQRLLGPGDTAFRQGQAERQERDPAARRGAGTDRPRPHVPADGAVRLPQRARQRARRLRGEQGRRRRLLPGGRQARRTTAGPGDRPVAARAVRPHRP